MLELARLAAGGVMSGQDLEQTVAGIPRGGLNLNFLDWHSRDHRPRPVPRVANVISGPHAGNVPTDGKGEGGTGRCSAPVPLTTNGQHRCSGPL